MLTAQVTGRSPLALAARPAGLALRVKLNETTTVLAFSSRKQTAGVAARTRAWRRMVEAWRTLRPRRAATEVLRRIMDAEHFIAGTEKAPS
jgi:hypothetical protein